MPVLQDFLVTLGAAYSINKHFAHYAHITQTKTKISISTYPLINKTGTGQCCVILYVMISMISFTLQKVSVPPVSEYFVPQGSWVFFPPQDRLCDCVGGKWLRGGWVGGMC